MCELHIFFLTSDPFMYNLAIAVKTNGFITMPWYSNLELFCCIPAECAVAIWFKKFAYMYVNVDCSKQFFMVTIRPLHATLRIACAQIVGEELSAICTSRWLFVTAE